MVIEGTFDVCRHCGGEVSVQNHLTGAHLSDINGEVHLAWHHAKCGVVSETAVSIQDYQSALSIMRLQSGIEVERIASEDEELLARFRGELARVKTPSDIGAWSDA